MASSYTKEMNSPSALVEKRKLSNISNVEAVAGNFSQIEPNTTNTLQDVKVIAKRMETQGRRPPFRQPAVRREYIEDVGRWIVVQTGQQDGQRMFLNLNEQGQPGSRAPGDSQYEVDHLVELWQLKDFVQKVYVILRHNAPNEACEIALEQLYDDIYIGHDTTISDFLNEPQNLQGVNARVNRLKGILLKHPKDYSSQWIRWHLWEVQATLAYLNRIHGRYNQMVENLKVYIDRRYGCNLERHLDYLDWYQFDDAIDALRDRLQSQQV